MEEEERPYLVHLLRGLEEQFGRRSKFCDVRLVSASNPEEEIGVHSPILMSLSPFMKKVLLESSPPFVLVLPEEAEFSEVKGFFKKVYGKMAHSELGEESVRAPEVLAEALKIIASPSWIGESNSTLIDECMTRRWRVLLPSSSCRKSRGKSVSRFELSAQKDSRGFVPRLGRFVCEYECGELFKSEFARERHHKEAHSGGEEGKKVDVSSSFICEVCGEVKNSYISLSSHRNLHHKKYECSNCEETFFGRYSYKRHFESAHGHRSECEVCGKTFQNKNYLRKHFSTVHVTEEDKTLSCEICDKKFFNSRILKNHLSYCRRRKGTDTCPICGKDFKLELLLKRHLQRVHKEDGLSFDSLPSYECDVCFKLFKEKFLLSRHKNIVHTPDQPTPFECDKCNRKFPSQDNLKDHNAIEHGSGEKLYECFECSKKLPTRPAFQYHMYFTHKTDAYRDKFECPECRKSFRSIGTLRAHEKRLHSLTEEERNKHICESCGKRFYRPYDLNLHVKVVHLRAGEFVCDFKDCGMTFNHGAYLKHHKARRHGVGIVREYYCDICGKQFRFRSYLNVHIRTKHSSEEDKKFICGYCPKRFALKSILNTHEKATHINRRRFKCGVRDCEYHSFNRRCVIQHQARRHGIGVTAQKPSCKFCGKTLGNKFVLERHIAIFHEKTDVKPFSCKYCQKKFRSSFNKEEHEMAMHIKAEPYKCEICGRGYNRAMSLRKHEKRLHQTREEKPRERIIIEGHQVEFQEEGMQEQASLQAQPTNNIIILTS